MLFHRQIDNNGSPKKGTFIAFTIGSELSKEYGFIYKKPSGMFSIDIPYVNRF